MSELTSAQIKEAAMKYYENNSEPPTEFYLQKFEDEEGNESWKCEFRTDYTDELTCWISNAKTVQKIFWKCDPDDLDLSNWDEEWTEKI